MRRTKKVLSLLVALCLVLGLMPAVTPTAEAVTIAGTTSIGRYASSATITVTGVGLYVGATLTVTTNLASVLGCDESELRIDVWAPSTTTAADKVVLDNASFTSNSTFTIPADVNRGRLKIKVFKSKESLNKGTSKNSAQNLPFLPNF